MGVAFCPDSGTSYFLTQKVGYHKAAELFWCGKILNVDEANELGLVNKVVPLEECVLESVRWAERIANSPLFPEHEKL